MPSGRSLWQTGSHKRSSPYELSHHASQLLGIIAVRLRRAPIERDTRSWYLPFPLFVSPFVPSTARNQYYRRDDGYSLSLRRGLETLRQVLGVVESASISFHSR